MSARKWKPGDVATWPGMGVVLCVGERDGVPKWAHQWGGFSFHHGDEIAPLVVADPSTVLPEMPDHVIPDLLIASAEIVYRTERREVHEVRLLRRLAALFEAACPLPKPDEPIGDGAVVVDNMGHRWVRIAGPHLHVDPKPWRHRGHSARDWAHLSAVSVLSEGVQR